MSAAFAIARAGALGPGLGVGLPVGSGRIGEHVLGLGVITVGNRVLGLDALGIIDRVLGGVELGRPLGQLARIGLGRLAILALKQRVAQQLGFDEGVELEVLRAAAAGSTASVAA